MRPSAGRGLVVFALAALVAAVATASAIAQEQYQDGFPPDTGIRKGPQQKTDKRKAKFEFGGSEPGVTFECRLDTGGTVGPWLPCASPHKLRGLARRTKYVFYVRAVDVSGNPDPRPADRRWKVTRKKSG